MSNVDDEDAFLYGSEEENAPPPITETPSVAETSLAPAEESNSDVKMEDGSDANGSGSEDESESDIEIIVSDVKQTVSAPTKSEETPSALDISKVPELNGKPISEVDLEEIANKPWRLPGADISDYFNFGFDEYTWIAYCMKQDQMRSLFDQGEWLKKVLKLPKFGMMAGMGMGMPGIPMPMPGMPMPNMPGMPTMPGMPGMPTMPTMPGMPSMPTSDDSKLPKMPLRPADKNERALPTGPSQMRSQSPVLPSGPKRGWNAMDDRLKDEPSMRGYGGGGRGRPRGGRGRPGRGRGG